MENHEPTSRSEALVVVAFSLGAAAVLVLIVFVLIGSGDQSGEQRLPPPSDSPSAPTSGPTSGSSSGSSSGPSSRAQGSVTELRGGAPSGRCLPPSVDLLRQQDVAVAGVVSEVRPAPSGRSVTLVLEPDRFYEGTETDLVTVEAPDGDLVPLLGVFSFTEGDRYLVAGRDGRVAVCGLSGAVSPSLEGLYEQAYG